MKRKLHQIAAEVTRKLMDDGLLTDDCNETMLNDVTNHILSAIEKALSKSATYQALGEKVQEIGRLKQQLAAHASEEKIKMKDPRQIAAEAADEMIASGIISEIFRVQTTKRFQSAIEKATEVLHKTIAVLRPTGFSIGNKLVEPTPDDR